MEVLLREITDNDMELVMAWRSSPLVYRGFYQQKKPLLWEEHYKWWHSRSDWKGWVIQVSSGTVTRDVGCIHFSQLNGAMPEIGFFIGEVSLWGKGVGKGAVKLALDWLKGQGYFGVKATTLNGNSRSYKLIESLGFRQVGVTEEGRQEYELCLK